MIVVVSQAWTKEGEEHAQAYIDFSENYGQFFDDHPGFHRRVLIRGIEDRTHFTNLRFFDTVEDYEECTRREGYLEYVQSMGDHLKPYETYPREFLEVVLDTGRSSTDPASV